MKLDNYRLIFITAGIIGLLLLSSPILIEFIPVPLGEKFSELYLLDSDHLTDNYPYTIELGKPYSIYVGVGNRLGTPAYYAIYVKLLSGSDPLPNTQTGESSLEKVIYEYNFIVDNNQTWETVLPFSISNGLISADQAIINDISIDGNIMNVNKVALWDSDSLSYPYRLLLELWVYNFQTDRVEYDNRYVYLNFNFSESA